MNDFEGFGNEAYKMPFKTRVKRFVGLFRKAKVVQVDLSREEPSYPWPLAENVPDPFSGLDGEELQGLRAAVTELLAHSEAILPYDHPLDDVAPELRDGQLAFRANVNNLISQGFAPDIAIRLGHIDYLIANPDGSIPTNPEANLWSEDLDNTEPPELG